MSPLRSRLLVLLCAVAGLSLGAPAAAGAAEAPPGFRFFAPDSIWNQPLRDDAPLLADSALYAARLAMSVQVSGAYVNSAKCGMPIYWADASTPRVTVTLDASSYQDPALIRAWSAVPIPADAKPANCTDLNFAVAQQQPDGTVSVWEFWKAVKQADGSWTARWGGAIKDAANDRGFASARAWTDPTAPVWLARRSTVGWNVTASSASMVGGVVTLEELQSGVIDHALAFAVTDAARGRWLWPAQRSDGGATDPYAIPEGARLRIDPSVDLDKRRMPPLVRMLAKAAQRYGFVVRDRTFSANLFYIEEPQAGEVDPVPALLDGRARWDAMRDFPWDKVQVLDAATCKDYAGCSVPPSAAIGVDATVIRPGDRVRLDTSNSVLDFPRSRVRWDLDGDGQYELDAGRACDAVVTPSRPGRLPVRVEITTQDGKTVTASRTLDVLGDGPSDAGSTPTPSPTASPAASPGFAAAGSTPAAASPPSTAAAVPAGCAAGTRVLVAGRRLRVLRAGRRLRLKGSVVDCPPGRRVVVEGRRARGHGWRKLGTAAVSSTGTFRWAGRMKGAARTAKLRVRLAPVAGTPGSGAVSATLEVRTRG